MHLTVCEPKGGLKLMQAICDPSMTHKLPLASCFVHCQQWLITCIAPIVYLTPLGVKQHQRFLCLLLLLHKDVSSHEDPLQTCCDSLPRRLCCLTRCNCVLLRSTRLTHKHKTAVCQCSTTPPCPQAIWPHTRWALTVRQMGCGRCTYRWR